MTMLDEDTPALGETMGNQGRIGIVTRFLGGSDDEMLGVIPPPTYKTYRQMRCDPTMAMARAASFAPIKAAAWRVIAETGAPEGARELVEKFAREHRAAI